METAAAPVLLQAITSDDYSTISEILKNANSAEAASQVLEHGCRDGNYQLVLAAIQNSDVVDIQGIIEKKHLLYTACCNGYFNIAALLLEKGAPVDLQEDERWSALMIASLNAHLQVVKLLLEKGARIDLQEDDGWSALMIASENGRSEIVHIMGHR